MGRSSREQVSRVMEETGPDSASARLNRACRGIASRFRSKRVWILGVAHLFAFALSYWLALALRFDFNVNAISMQFFLLSLPWVLALKATVFFCLGHYDGWWSYVTFGDLLALLKASLLSLVLIAFVDHFAVDYQIPRGLLILDCMITIMILGSCRASWRMFSEQFRPMLKPEGFRWALLVGADHSSAILAHQIQSHYSQLPYRIRGLISVDATKGVSRMGQLLILGNLDDIREIAVAGRVTDILVTSGIISGERLRRLMELCDEAGLTLKIIPPVEDRLNGDHRVPIRSIEINDLLQRDPITLDTEKIESLIEGRVVMVTGAGGSIGSEICRQVIKFNPRAILLVGKGENSLFKIEKELQLLETSTTLRPCIADVTNKQRMQQVFEEYYPEVVFHAAAHKHVPLMEANVGQAVRNNVFGTKCVADMANKYGVHSFVMVSTDKAVNPSSMMGVSKQIAERYVHTLSQESSTRFTVVRFGNVLGSNGSVVPVFQDQIRRGGPITVTDERMTRFFMTIPEASQLVLQAATMGSGGEIFVLEMGEPVRIVDLAKDLIRLSGLPANAIEIVFTGIRPGEKLYEELYFDDEETLPTSHPKLRAAYHRPYVLSEVREAISQLEQLIHAPEETLRQKLRAIVPEYSPPGESDTSAPEDRTEEEPEGVKNHL